MFESETQQFFHLIRSNTIDTAPSIGLRSILESNIPENVKIFFRADVEWLRTQEKKLEIRSPKFSSSLPELRLLEDQIDLLLINNYSFNRNDFDATADKCIHFLLNYLCRPQWTLQSFFFDTSMRITVGEMQSKLRYCNDYPYYREILIGYASTRQRTDIGSEEMKRLLTTIDDEICRTATADELAIIAKPIFDFLGTIRASMRPFLSAVVPVRALIYFFEDKRLTTIVGALSALRDRDSNLLFTFDMLKMVIESVLTGSTLPDIGVLTANRALEQTHEPTITEDVHTYTSIVPDTTSRAIGSTNVDNYTNVEPTQAFVKHKGPIRFVFGENGLEQNGLEQVGLEQVGLEQDGLEQDGLERYGLEQYGLEQDEKPITSPPQFSENDKSAITETLFHGSAELFDAAIETTLRAETWYEASEALDGFFAAESIDPYTKEAMMLTNILESWHRTLKL